MTLRRRCQWLHDPIALDGLGPVRPDDTYTDGVCQTCAYLVELGLNVNKRNDWLRRLLYRIAQLEGDGHGHFGGTAILAWFLCERTKPVPPMTKAKEAQIRRVAGTWSAYQRLMRIAHVPAPKRLRGGWTAQEVVSYVAGLVAERKKEREIHAGR